MRATSAASTDDADAERLEPGGHLGNRRPAVGRMVGREVALHRQLPAHPVDDATVGLVDDQGVDAGVVDDEAELRPGQPEVQRHERRTQPGGGEHRLEERRLVHPEEPDAVAVGHAAGAQGGSQPVDPVEQLLVGPGHALERQRPPVRSAAGAPGQPGGQAEIGFGHGAPPSPRCHDPPYRCSAGVAPGPPHLAPGVVLHPAHPVEDHGRPAPGVKCRPRVPSGRRRSATRRARCGPGRGPRHPGGRRRRRPSRSSRRCRT